MNKKLKYTLITINLVLLLVYFNYSIYDKEQILKEGKLVLLELAPVDPRSLMQGDYMRLNYVVNDVDYDTNIEKRGYMILRQDQKGVAQRIRFATSNKGLKPGEFAVKYFTNGFRNVHLGAESYFFEEGQSKRFEKSKYGAIRIDNEGNSLLVAMYDEHQKQINY